jgi:pimeloyl-ACP methyl ester carboxylesterase
MPSQIPADTMTHDDRPEFQLSHDASGEGDTLLLLHGSASNGAVWRRYVDPFVNAGYRVVVPDLIGYGKTSAWPRETRYTLDCEVELACRLLPPDGGRFHAIGHSFGGVVALGLALRNLPELASLTLIEPVAFFLLPYAHESEAYAEILGIRASFLDELERGLGDAALRVFLGYWTGAGSWDAMPERARAEVLRCVEKLRLDFEASFDTDPGVEAIRGISVPTLLVQGTRSTLPARRIIAALLRMLPQVQLQLVDGANHLLPLTHAPALTESVLRHLEAAAKALPRHS